jgi:NADH:ubiquinone oxidoreductase subunit 4 (subunit M)
VQRVFWNPVTRDENRKLRDIRPSELVAAATLIVLMVWIGVRPNDVLDRIRPSVEQIRRSVNTIPMQARAVRELPDAGARP